LDYIRVNYAQDFPMDDLAALCDMSPTHFRRTFTGIMGEGPLSYLTHIRISKASVLLRTTEMPVLDISEEVGFRSVSSFNRHFAEIMGVPPLKWRKQMSYIYDQSVLKYTGWLVPPKS
jgi:transcriptional regulator GlxA family with amidase domain